MQENIKKAQMRAAESQHGDGTIDLTFGSVFLLAAICFLGVYKMSGVQTYFSTKIMPILTRAHFVADVVGALPRALAELGHHVSVFVPKYRQTKLNDPKTLIRSITVPYDDQYRFCSILDGGTLHGVQFYFIDYPPFFDREALYGTSLGVRLADGRQEEHGHRNHMRAINTIRGAGGLAEEVHRLRKISPLYKARLERRKAGVL